MVTGKMSLQFVSYGVIFFVFVSGIYGKLSVDIQPCKAGDEVCLVNTINEVIGTKYTGDPELNLRSIDPIQIPEMTLKQPKDSPLNIEIVIKNGEMYGYKNFRAYKVRGFGGNPEGKHEIFLKGPTAAFLGDYLANGMLYTLLVDGDGRLNITADETDLHIAIDAGSTVKDGAVYMDIKNVELNMETTRAYFNFGNIVKGNKELSDKINQFIDANWHDIYLQIRRSILDALGLVHKDILRQVFDSHPYSELVQGGD